MPYTLTQHARDVIEKRKISFEWLERALNSPQRIEQDGTDSDLEHRLTTIEEYGCRVLRVIVNFKVCPIKVVTAYFDRNVKDKL
jgi:uncharacterized DUF497 family protein